MTHHQVHRYMHWGISGFNLSFLDLNWCTMARDYVTAILYMLKRFMVD